MFLNNPNEIHVMLDLETVSLAPNAGIVQIGAVVFGPGTVSITEEIEFNGHIKFESLENWNALSSCKTDFDIDVGTLEWWDKQDAKLRAKVFSGVETVGDIVTEFADWLCNLQDSNKQVILWGNGANFDNVIIHNALELVVGNSPISYKNNRCYRTMIQLMPQNLWNLIPANESKHDALADAKYQATNLEILNNNIMLRS